MKSAARDVAATLRERARALARPADPEVGGVEAVATFVVGGCTVGAPLACVACATDLRHVTEVPGAPPWLIGVAAVEGHLVSLVDLAVFLDFGRRGVADVRGTVVVTAQERKIGLVVEEFLGIADLPSSCLVAVSGVTGPLQRVAPGRGARGGDLLVLDVDLLFEDPRLSRQRG